MKTAEERLKAVIEEFKAVEHDAREDWNHCKTSLAPQSEINECAEILDFVIILRERILQIATQ